MATSYETFGPFALTRDRHRLQEGALNTFWSERDVETPGLSQAVGIYIFLIRSGKDETLRPWYVGRTDRQGFKKRFTQKDLHFRQVLESKERDRWKYSYWHLKRQTKNVSEEQPRQRLGLMSGSNRHS